MGGFKKISGIFLSKKSFKKVIAYGILIGLLFVVKDFLWIFFMTFLFAYLFYSTACFIQKRLENFSQKYKWWSFANKIPLWILVLLEYIIFIGVIVYFVSNIVPTVRSEVTAIFEEFTPMSEEIGMNWEKHAVILWEWAEESEAGSKKIIRQFNSLKGSLLQRLILLDPEDNMHLQEWIENFGKELDFKSIWKGIADNLGIIWSNILKVILSLILSFIFIIDRKKLWSYLYKVKESNFGFLYKEYDLLLEKVVKSFGLIIKAQSMIALVNSLLTVLGLFIIGYVFRTVDIPWFPYIITLWLVVFVFGFVPVLWVILSSIPIMLVAYANYWQPMVLLMIALLITIVHMIEAYYLNPKIVSRFLELPVSLTFVILILSEHFFWLAWLLIGISMFYFSMWLLKDFNKVLWKRKNKKN